MVGDRLSVLATASTKGEEEKKEEGNRKWKGKKKGKYRKRVKLSHNRLFDTFKTVSIKLFPPSKYRGSF